MKKILFFFLLSSPFFSNGQTRFGLRAGINLSSMRFGDYHPPKRILPRFNTGVMAGIPINEHWSFNTGIGYAGKGVIFERTFSTGRVDSFTIRLNYIELPLMIGYTFNPGNDNSLVFMAGPTIGYGFNGSFKTIHSNSEPTWHLHKKETDQFKRMEFGYGISAAYDIKSRYGVRVDYSGSMINIGRAEKEWNSLFGLSFTWWWPCKNKTGSK